jgi:cytochrome c biogenesis protein CcdA
VIRFFTGDGKRFRALRQSSHPGDFRGSADHKGGMGLALAARAAASRGMADITIPVVLFAGFISFISPCVLPLVPPYLCFLAGTTFEHVLAREPSSLVARREVATAAIFVAGFSTVFVALGAGASASAGCCAPIRTFSIVAGVAIITMGLHFLGVSACRS